MHTGGFDDGRGNYHDHSAQRKIKMYKLELHAVSSGYVARLSLHWNRHQLLTFQTTVKIDNSLSRVKYELESGPAA